MINVIKLQNKLIRKCLKNNLEMKINCLLKQQRHFGKSSLVAADVTATTRPATKNSEQTEGNCTNQITVDKPQSEENPSLATHQIHPIIDKYRKQLRAKKGQLNELFNNNWSSAYTYYERVSHMDEVRISYDKVIVIQDKLQEAQESRRNLQNDLFELRRNIQHIRDEIRQTHKINEHYVGLVTAECNKLREEDLVREQFNLAETYERDLFSHLTAAVKATHEKEKIYTHTVKYWSIIGSIVGAVIGVVGSAIGYHYRDNYYKLLTDSYTAQVITINENLTNLREDFDKMHKSVLAAAQSNVAAAAASPITTSASESWSDFAYRQSVGVYRAGTWAAMYPIRKTISIYKYFWPSGNNVSINSKANPPSAMAWYNYYPFRR